MVHTNGTVMENMNYKHLNYHVLLAQHNPGLFDPSTEGIDTRFFRLQYDSMPDVTVMEYVPRISGVDKHGQRVSGTVVHSEEDLDDPDKSFKIIEVK